MFRREGLLNYAQLYDLVIEKCSSALDSYEEGSDPEVSKADRQVLFIAWAVRVIFDYVRSVVLINGEGRAIEVDAWRVLWTNGEDKISQDINFPTHLDKSTLNVLLSEVVDCWDFVDHGVLVIPGPRWRSFLRGHSRWESLRQQLLPFRGWTVTVKEGEAREIVDIANRRRDAGRLSANNRHENVIGCFHEAFPNGKQGATWNEVQRKVGYSRRTILRALSAVDGQGPGQLGGQ